jgi:hypothetical protein
MGKRLSDAEVAHYGRDGFLFALRGGIMSGSIPRRTWLLTLIICLTVAGCSGTGGTGYAPAQDDQTTSARSGSDGGDSGGSSM